MPSSNAAWTRIDYTGVNGSGQNGNAVDVNTEEPYTCSKFGAPSMRDWLLFITPEVPDEGVWGPPNIDGSGVFEEPVIAFYVSDIGCNFAPADRPTILIKTHANLIAPATGVALWTLWGAGIDLAEIQIEGRGWHFLTMKDNAAIDLFRARDNGIMIGINDSVWNAITDEGSMTITKFRLFSHVRYEEPDTIFYPSNDFLNRLPISDVVKDELNLNSSDAKIEFEGLIDREVRQKGGNIILDKSNIALSDLFAKQEIDFIEPWKLPDLNTTAFLIGEDFANDPSYLESLLGCFFSLSVYLIIKGTRTLIYRIGGTISNVDSTVDGLKIAIMSAFSGGIEFPIYNDEDSIGYRIGGVIPDAEVLFGTSFGEVTWTLLHELLMNMRSGARKSDLFVNDWVYLRERFVNIWYYLRNTGYASSWTGKTIKDAIETIASMYGLFIGISQQGNLMVWHPAVYRPSMRVHELNLDTQASGVVITRPNKDNYSVAMLSGDGMFGSISEQIMLYLTLETFLTGESYELNPVDGEGEVPYHYYPAWDFRRSLLKQHVARVSGSMRQIECEVNNTGLLYDIGDQVKVSSNLFDMDEDTYMVVGIEPSIESPTKVTLMRWLSDESKHCLFEEDGPKLIIRDETGENKCWTSVGALADFVPTGPDIIFRRSSWQGKLIYSAVGDFLRGAAALSNAKQEVYQFEYGGSHTTMTNGGAWPIFRLRHTSDNSAFVVLIKNEEGADTTFPYLKMYAGWCPDEAFIDDPTTYVNCIEFEDGVGTGNTDSIVWGGYIGTISLVIPVTSSPTPPVLVYKNCQLIGTSTLGYAKNDGGWEFTEIEGWKTHIVGEWGICAGIYSLFINQDDAGVFDENLSLLPESGYDIFYP